METKPALEAQVRNLVQRNDRDSLVRLCEAYWHLGRVDDAIATYRRVLSTEASPDESEFDRIYLEALSATGTCPMPARRRKRLIRLVELLASVGNLAGDAVECGCYRGLSSYTLCAHLRKWDPRFDGTGYHIFDSFAGLSHPTEDDDIPDGWQDSASLRLMSRQGHFAASLPDVKSNLRSFPGITYHAGWIPLSFKGLPERRYRFAHVDVDLYDPTLDAFEYFYPRLAAGGLLVSDDYSWPGARTAIDEFCASRDIEPDVNAFNQAVVRKAA
jgi:predicted O-methyltransferase YrrM